MKASRLLFARHIAPLLVLAMYVADVVPFATSLRAYVERTAVEAKPAASRDALAGLLLIASRQVGQGRLRGTPPAAPESYSALNALSTELYNPRPLPDAVTAVIDLPATFQESSMGKDVNGVTIGYGTVVSLSDAGSLAANTAALQAAIDAAGDRGGNTDIQLTGAWTSGIGTPVIRTHTLGDYHTRIRWTGLAVTEGDRVTPSDVTDGPVFIGDLSSDTRAVKFDRSANNTRFVGITFKHPTGTVSQVSYDLVPVFPIEGSTEYVTDVATIPDQVGFDRCLIEGNDRGVGDGDVNDTGNVRNGLTLNAKRSFVVDSYIHQIGWWGNESKGFICYNTPGPLKIVNNFIEATGINALFGGVIPQYGATEGSPTDVEFRRNHLFKRMAWAKDDVAWDGVVANGGRACKNLWETKNVRRCLLEGNVMENNWADGQSGMALVVKSAADGSTSAAGCETNNLVIRYNIIRNSTRCWNFAANSDDPPDATPANTTACYHNLAYNIGAFAGQSDGLAFLFTQAYDDLYFANNTTVLNVDPSAAFQMVNMDTPNKSDRFIFTDNILGFAYVTSDLGQLHTTGLDYYSESATRQWDRNVIYEMDAEFRAFYPQLDNSYIDNVAAVGFENVATDNYRLSSGSAYKGTGLGGTDPGCDVDDVELATSGVAA